MYCAVQNEGNGSEPPFDSLNYPVIPTEADPLIETISIGRCYGATLTPTETEGEYLLSFDNGYVGTVLVDPSVLDSGEPYIFTVSAEGPIQPGSEGLVTDAFFARIIGLASLPEYLKSTVGTELERQIQLVPTP